MDKTKIQIKKFSLDNGLTIVLAPDNRTPQTALSVAYNLSTKELLKRKVGLPHFTEHMTFPMSTGGHKREEFANFIYTIGAKSWAETREDYILFSSIFPNKKFPLFLKLEAKRMNFLHFNRDTFLFEKEKIKRERFLLYKKKPYLYSLDELLKKGFENTPYSKSLIGTPEEVEKIRIEDIYSFYKDYFSPNNATLVVAGNFNDNEAIEIITDYFEGVSSSFKLDPFVLKKTPFASKIILISKNIPIEPAAHFAFRIFPRRRESNHIFCVLEYILNNEMKKALDKIILNSRRITLKVIANYLEKPTLSLFMIFISFRGRVKAKDIINIFFKSLDVIKSNITENTIKSVKLQLLSEFYDGLNSLMNRTQILTEYFLIDGDPMMMNSEIGKLSIVTKKDILTILDKYFIPENMIFVGTNLKD